MRACQVIRPALIVAACLMSSPAVRGEDPPGTNPAAAKATTATPAQSGEAPKSATPLPKDDVTAKPIPPAAVSTFTPGSREEVVRVRADLAARLEALGAADKDTPASKAIREVLERRKVLLGEWDKASKARDEADHPSPSPEQVGAELKDDLQKTRARLDQAAKTPDALLPEAFGPPVAGAVAKTTEVRLTEMKEAIDAARIEIRERATELGTLREEATKAGSSEVTTRRATRDKLHQEVSALAAGRGDREAAINSAGSAEARELARDRFLNSDWESRVAVESLAAAEARLALAKKRSDLGAVRVKSKETHLDLDRRLLELMEHRYASQSERQQTDLKQAVAKEENKAAHTEDVLERYRAKRSADLLELEAEAVAYEKASATTHDNLSIDKQTKLADETATDFETLKKRLNDGNVSPLDVLRLKNAFRQIGPLRASIVKGELAEVKSELSSYETALADAEIGLVNDARDDRIDRDALLDKLPMSRHREAEAMLDAMEVRHRALLDRTQKILAKLAQRSEDTQFQILRRLRLLDEEFAFVRTHIFWVRDAEPVGPTTLAHARDESLLAARALVKLAAEPWDRTLWGRVMPDFVVALVGLVLLPWPLRLGQRALDRLRLAQPDPSLIPDPVASTIVG